MPRKYTIYKLLFFAGSQFAARIHRDARSAALDARWLLEDGVGEQQPCHRHAHALHRKGPWEVRPLLAHRHASGLLRRHICDHTERGPLLRLEYHRIHASQSEFSPFLMSMKFWCKRFCRIMEFWVYRLIEYLELIVRYFQVWWKRNCMCVATW